MRSRVARSSTGSFWLMERPPEPGHFITAEGRECWRATSITASDNRLSCPGSSIIRYQGLVVPHSKLELLHLLIDKLCSPPNDQRRHQHPELTLTFFRVSHQQHFSPTRSIRGCQSFYSNHYIHCSELAAGQQIIVNVPVRLTPCVEPSESQRRRRLALCAHGPPFHLFGGRRR